TGGRWLYLPASGGRRGRLHARAGRSGSASMAGAADRGGRAADHVAAADPTAHYLRLLAAITSCCPLSVAATGCGGVGLDVPGTEPSGGHAGAQLPARRQERSEERRVGKECRSRWSGEQEKKN